MKTKTIIRGALSIMLSTLFIASSGCTPKSKEEKKGEKIVFAAVDTTSTAQTATKKENWVTETSVSTVEGAEGSPAVTAND